MKKVKLIKKKRLKKKPSTTEGSEGSESTTAEGGSEGEIRLLKRSKRKQHQFSIRLLDKIAR